MVSDSDGGSNDDSRTANVAAQASSHASAKSSASNSPLKPKRKRARKREKKRLAKLALSAGATLSESAAYLDPSAATNVDDPSAKDTPQDSPQSANMASSFGKNRLASGFAPRQTAVDNTATIVAQVQVPNNNTSTDSPSNNEPIEISSSDESSSVSDNEDGGMIVNIDAAKPKMLQSRQAQIQGEHVNTAIPPPPPLSQAPPPPPPPQSSGLRLEDLDNDELEDQIRGESSEDGEFIRPTVKAPGATTRRVPDFQFGPTREQPRFGDLPNNGDARGRSSWYATDSFGARRSRSPKNAASDRYRPGLDRQRSPRRFDSGYQNRPPSPPRRGPPPPAYDSYNSYRPDDRSYPPSYHNSGYNSRPASPDRDQPQWPTMTLPTRKGSNPNLNPLASRVSAPNSNSNASSAGPSKKKKKTRAKSQKFDNAG
ncbi:uncharacterized protein AB675_4807 [Cyphellophora attinorum]|uniref:Uncharacterized protein n=1 Tax=Cyphellophora attinorum TaxID=1664694 RepID=A0A0N0NIM2_9EURO|nr:uncharacterized protein AB675_4807 [Phialophora attinorum]KPI35609.1 hypothetical protein AB675_4807 [Phialophora attinorum]